MCFSLLTVVLRSLNTSSESRRSDARHAVRNNNGSQAFTTPESIVPNARYAVRYYRILTTRNQPTCFRFDNAVTVIARVILCIPVFHIYRSQIATIQKDLLSNILHAIGNRN